VIYLIGGKDKISSRKSLLDFKKNYSPDATQTIVVDKTFDGSIGTAFRSQSLFGGKPLVVLELTPDWKKHEGALVESLPKVNDAQADALLWVDGALPKNSKLFKVVTELGGQISFFEEPDSKAIWTLLDALAGKNRPLALAELQKLLQNGESAIGITVMITYLTRNLLSTIYKNNYYQGLSPWQKKKLQETSRNFTEKELLDIYSYLLSVDMALKTSNLSEDLLLTNLVIAITTKHHAKSIAA
jgi:DNA polymerase III delta subunit